MGKPKNRVVVFTSNNARVLVNPPDIELLKDQPNVLVNPDLSRVLGVPPHFWTRKDGQIVEMTRPEKVARLEDHAANGIDNELPALEPTLWRTLLTLMTYCKHFLAWIGALLVGYLIGQWGF